MFDDFKLGNELKPGQPGFNEYVMRQMLAYPPFQQALTMKCPTPGQWSLLIYQMSVVLGMRPGSPITRALSLARTGAGKTVIMFFTLDNYYEDRRPKILGFANDKQVKNFYSKLMQFPSRYQRYILEKTKGRINAGNGEQHTEEIADILAMKGHLSRAGQPGYLPAPVRAFRYTVLGGETIHGANGPSRAIFKVGYDGVNAFSNKVIVMDEVHNIVVPPVEIASRPDWLGKVRRARRKLFECRNSVILGLTATAIVNEAKDGFELLEMIKGEEFVDKHGLTDLKVMEDVYKLYMGSNATFVANKKNARGYSRSELLYKLDKFLDRQIEAFKPPDIETAIPIPPDCEGFVFSFNYLSPAIYPRVTPGPPDKLWPEIHYVPLIGANLRQYTVKERGMKGDFSNSKNLYRLMNYCLTSNYAGTSHAPTTSFYKGMMKDPASFATKATVIMESIEENPVKTLVIVHRASGLKTFSDVLMRIRKKDNWLVLNSKPSPQADLKRLAAFNAKDNQRGEKHPVCIIDAKDYSESVDFINVRRCILADVPHSYANYLQRVGRVLRMCKFQDIPIEQQTVHMDMYLSTVPSKRELRELVEKKLMTIGSELEEKFFAKEKKRVEKDLVSKSKKIAKFKKKVEKKKQKRRKDLDKEEKKNLRELAREWEKKVRDMDKEERKQKKMKERKTKKNTRKKRVVKKAGFFELSDEDIRARRALARQFDLELPGSRAGRNRRIDEEADFATEVNRVTLEADEKAAARVAKFEESRDKRLLRNKESMYKKKGLGPVDTSKKSAFKRIILNSGRQSADQIVFDYVKQQQSLVQPAMDFFGAIAIDASVMRRFDPVNQNK